MTRGRIQRCQTGGGLSTEDNDLTEVEEMFLDYAGVEGVVGKYSTKIHTYSAYRYTALNGVYLHNYQ